MIGKIWDFMVEYAEPLIIISIIGGFAGLLVLVAVAIQEDSCDRFMECTELTDDKYKCAYILNLQHKSVDSCESENEK